MKAKNVILILGFLFTISLLSSSNVQALGSFSDGLDFIFSDGDSYTLIEGYDYNGVGEKNLEDSVFIEEDILSFYNWSEIVWIWNYYYANITLDLQISESEFMMLDFLKDSSSIDDYFILLINDTDYYRIYDFIRNASGYLTVKFNNDNAQDIIPIMNPDDTTAKILLQNSDEDSHDYSEKYSSASTRYIDSVTKGENNVTIAYTEDKDTENEYVTSETLFNDTLVQDGFEELFVPKNIFDWINITDLKEEQDTSQYSSVSSYFPMIENFTEFANYQSSVTKQAIFNYIIISQDYSYTISYRTMEYTKSSSMKVVIENDMYGFAIKITYSGDTKESLKINGNIIERDDSKGSEFVKFGDASFMIISWLWVYIPSGVAIVAGAIGIPLFMRRSNIKKYKMNPQDFCKKHPKFNRCKVPSSQTKI